MRELRGGIKDERGFTLPELLVTVLVIGILAAIAIPAFLGQQDKAYDASAKELAHSAEVAAETYATDSGNGYVGLTPSAINQYESAIPITPASGGAYLATVTNATATGYTITIRPARGPELYILTRSNGAITRSCTPSSGINGGCFNGSW